MGRDEGQGAAARGGDGFAGRASASRFRAEISLYVLPTGLGQLSRCRTQHAIHAPYGSPYAVPTHFRAITSGYGRHGLSATAEFLNRSIKNENVKSRLSPFRSVARGKRNVSELMH